MILNKIFSPAASIIKFFIIFFIIFNSNAEEKNIKYFPNDKGTLSLMYHRFDENKYPSTNIRIEIFKKQIDLIKEKKFQFYDPSDFEINFNSPKDEKKVLITIDDGFSSFYESAWPILKNEKIPFILFVSTEAVGKNGYMSWEEIKEVEKESFAYIGNHSHSHNYLINYNFQYFKNDIKNSISIFKENLGYNPIFFSYPFGEYNLRHKEFISKNFKFSFGQHSGVIDMYKDRYELPRFPINEKYGDLERFAFLINLLPLHFKNILPEEKIIQEENNPPNIKIKFYEGQKNLKNINCFSNDGENWNSPEIKFEENYTMIIKPKNKFNLRRGRINCSLNDEAGWRWLGIQYSNPTISD